MSCHTMRPECWVPATDGTAVTWACCWLCAHAIVEHDMPLGGTLTDCGCKREDIYPSDVLAHMDGRSLFVEPAQDRTQKPAPEELFEVVSPMYDVHGRVLEDAPMLVQTFRKLDVDADNPGKYRAAPVSVTYRPRVKRVGAPLVKRKAG